MEKEEIKEENNPKTSEDETKPLSDKELTKEEISPEDTVKELEEKLTRTLAEMENQRRRFEKEKDEAFEYGGFSFAKETLNLLDN